jgi:hypothetical protein
VAAAGKQHDELQSKGPRSLLHRRHLCHGIRNVLVHVPPHCDFFDRYKGRLLEAITQSELEKLNSSLGSFFALLRRARRLYLEEGDGGRAGAFTALGAMWRFIAIFEVPHAESLQVPILHLQNALATLEKNNVLPILKPLAHGGRAVSSHAHTAFRGFVAGTVKRLLEAGCDPRRH